MWAKVAVSSGIALRVAMHRWHKRCNSSSILEHLLFREARGEGVQASRVAELAARSVHHGIVEKGEVVLPAPAKVGQQPEQSREHTDTTRKHSRRHARARVARRMMPASQMR